MNQALSIVQLMLNASWVVQAVVVLHASEQASEAELLDFCRGRIAGYKRPQAVRFVADHDMPRTATGKILHRVLRDQLTAQPDSAVSVR